MRFLANENIPGEAVASLRRAGHDVAWVRLDAPGSSDAAVLARAISEMRILVTFDKDFGELSVRSDLPADCGVVLFRIPMPPSNRVGNTITQLIGQRDDRAGHFSVIEPGRIRIRTLPLR